MARPSIELRNTLSEAAWDEKRGLYGLHSECYDLAMPGLSPYAEGMDGWMGRRGLSSNPYREDELYDHTLGDDAQKLATRLINRTFPAGREWAEIEMGDDEPGAYSSPDVENQKLKKSKEELFAILDASSFTLQANVMGREGVVVGTGLMKVREGRTKARPVEFDAVSQAEVALEGDATGQIWGYWRKLELTAEGIERLWPDAKKVDTRLTGRKGKEKPETLTVHEGTRYDVDTGSWRYFVDLRSGETGKTQPLELFEDEFLVCPWVCWRYGLAPGDLYGRSPVMTGMAHARVLNHAKRIRLQAASIRSVGCWTVPDGDVFNPLTSTIRSGAVLTVDTNQHDAPSLRALELPGDPSLNEIVVQDEQQQIHVICLMDLLPGPRDAVRTATEWLERKRKDLENIGGPMLRLQEEIGRPVLQAAAYFAMRKGRLEEFKQRVKGRRNGEARPPEMDGTDYQVAFNSPLVEAQRLSDVQRISEWGMTVQQFGQLALEAGVVVEQVGEVTGKKMKIPKELIRTQNDQQAWIAQAQAAQATAGAADPGMAPPEGAGLAL